MDLTKRPRGSDLQDDLLRRREGGKKEQTRTHYDIAYMEDGHRVIHNRCPGWW